MIKLEKLRKNETIRELAEIQIGYQLRAKPKEAEAGAVLLIQPKDIHTSRSHLDLSEETVRFDPERSIEKQRLEEGYILFMGKGSKPFACPVCGLPGPAVASGMFFILRPDASRVLPDYLAWVLNREEHLRKMMTDSGTGVAMPVIRRKVLEELAVPLPPLNVQKKIGELLSLADEEQELLTELAEQKLVLMNGLCRQLMAGTIR